MPVPRLDKDLQAELFRFLDLILPNQAGRATWQQEPYRDDYFGIWNRARERGIVHCDVVFQDVRDLWLSQRDDLMEESIRADTFSVLSSMQEAWDEWHFAWTKFPRWTG